MSLSFHSHGIHGCRSHGVALQHFSSGKGIQGDTTAKSAYVRKFISPAPPMPPSEPMSIGDKRSLHGRSLKLTATQMGFCSLATYISAIMHRACGHIAWPSLAHLSKSSCLRLAVRMQTYMQNLLTYIPHTKRKVPARRPMWAGRNWKSMVALPGTRSALTRWVLIFTLLRFFRPQQRCT